MFISCLKINELQYVTSSMFCIELFSCHVNTLLRNTHWQIQCTPPSPPQIRLRADLQQIESKEYLFSHRQAVPAPQHYWSFLLCQWSRPCRQQEAVAGSRGFLLCLLPVRGLKMGNILVLRRPGRRTRPPCSLRPRLPSFPFLVGTAQTLSRPQCLGVEVFAIQRRWSLWRPADRSSRGKMKHPGRTPGRPQSAWTRERSLPVQGLTWRAVWRTGPCRVRCRLRRSWTST